MRYTAERPAIRAAASTMSGTIPPGAEPAAIPSGTPATLAGRAFIRRVDGYAAFPPGTYTPARATGRTRWPMVAPGGAVPTPPLPAGNVPPRRGHRQDALDAGRPGEGDPEPALDLPPVKALDPLRRQLQGPLQRRRNPPPRRVDLPPRDGESLLFGVEPVESPRVFRHRRVAFLPNPPENLLHHRGHLLRSGGAAGLRPRKRLAKSPRSRPVPPHASRLLLLHPDDVGAQGSEPVFQRLVPAVEVVDPEHLGGPGRGQARQHQRRRRAKVRRHERGAGKFRDPPHRGHVPRNVDPRPHPPQLGHMQDTVLA